MTYIPMPRIFGLSFFAAITGISMFAQMSIGAEVFEERKVVEEEREDSLYYQQLTYRPDTRAIIHQKAQARAYQRATRLASTEWYGMYNSRPTAAPTPFTSLYSPVWEMPGGRPYAWHHSFWPGYVVYTR